MLTHSESSDDAWGGLPTQTVLNTPHTCEQFAKSPASTEAYTKKFRPTFPERTIKGSRLCTTQEFGVIKRDTGVVRHKHVCVRVALVRIHVHVYRGAGTYVQANCIVCEHVEANEGGTERTRGNRGWRSVRGARVAGNSRSGAATPVTSVGASANQ